MLRTLSSLLMRILRNPIWQMSLLAAASVEMYLVGLTLPFNLLNLWGTPRLNVGRVTLGKVMQTGMPAEMHLTLTLIGLFALYGLALIVIRKQSDDRLWRPVIAGILGFNLVLALMAPFGASDVFDYIIRGRIQSVYHANPFQSVPDDYKGDRFFRYSAWPSTPSAYGPVWEMIAAGASALAGGDDVITNVLVFKLVNIAFYAGAATLIAATLMRTAPGRALSGVVLFAWNPLVVYSTAGHGHNDSVMIFFVMLGLYFFTRKQYTLAAVWQVVGALVKFIPVLMFPIIIAAALKRLRDWKPQARYLAVTGAASLLLLVAAYIPYWYSGDVLSIARRTTLFTTSLPSLAELWLENLLSEAKKAPAFAQEAIALLALAALAACVAWQTWKAWRQADSDDIPARAGLTVLLFYLLVICAWFQPWYVIWPLALAAILPDGPLVVGTLILSYAAIWKFPIFHFLLVRGKALPPRIWREPLLTFLTLGLAWMYFILMGVRQKARKLWRAC